ncbi:hypothetical protein EKO23_13640 [Nocardioides guangzhouensis]|uniref:Mycothiol-dependent maleylpyruvate isomerase metal-binding domain-containing protein n=1 Tax=Nocardioides guangzhouensis TaxID=2497878 RepID=A0A4Q4ZAR0_9ACTN|nr:maleylpyruvate isomerase N-terminal domain-containing protein [Nocardioides guangzhouensis]RYP85027.1 hypothetical protein EKO23_13640 [Nocardioides guangzhouensis]
MSAALLESAYAAFEEAVASVDEEASWEPTGCSGWAVRDLVFHVLCDAQRALVALHTPAPYDARPDRDAVTYWEGWGSDTEGDANGRRWTRVSGAMFRDWTRLAALHGETSAAARDAVRRSDPGALVATQGHVLTVGDLASTLAVEATVHHLDLVAHLDGRPGPEAGALAEVRRVVEALAGPFPADLDDVRVALIATGRAAPDDAERTALAEVLPNLPAFS